MVHIFFTMKVRIKNLWPEELRPEAKRKNHARAKCPLLVSDVLLSHGLTPQYHRRSGA